MHRPSERADPSTGNCAPIQGVATRQGSRVGQGPEAGLWRPFNVGAKEPLG